MFAVERQMLSPHGVEGALPSSSTQRKILAPHGVEEYFPSSSTKKVHQALNGKEKIIEVSHGEIDQEHEYAYEVEANFELVYLEWFYDTTTSSIAIKENEAQIKELQTHLEREKFIISFLEQENKQLTDKKTPLEMKFLPKRREKND